MSVEIIQHDVALQFIIWMRPSIFQMLKCCRLLRCGFRANRIFFFFPEYSKPIVVSKREIRFVHQILQKICNFYFDDFTFSGHLFSYFYMIRSVIGKFDNNLLRLYYSPMWTDRTGEMWKIFFFRLKSIKNRIYGPDYYKTICRILGFCSTLDPDDVVRTFSNEKARKKSHVRMKKINKSIVIYIRE